MSVNMMNNDHKAMNEKSRKGYLNTFTFSKRDKDLIDKHLENYPKEQIDNIYNTASVIEEFFGYNTKVVLDLDIKNDILLAAIQIPKKRVNDINDEYVIADKLEVLNTDYPYVVWIKEYI
jgi:hypothetical protein